MPLHVFILMTQRPILSRELAHTRFEFLGSIFDTSAFFVTTMLNTFELIPGELGFTPEFYIEILERPDLLLQRILLRASQGQLGLSRIDVDHRLFVLRLADTADHRDCADHHDRRHPSRLHACLPSTIRGLCNRCRSPLSSNRSDEEKRIE